MRRHCTDTVTYARTRLRLFTIHLARLTPFIIVYMYVCAYLLFANCAAVALRGGSSGVSGASGPPYLALPPCASANRFDMVDVVVLCRAYGARIRSGSGVVMMQEQQKRARYDVLMLSLLHTPLAISSSLLASSKLLLTPWPMSQTTTRIFQADGD
ncbi:hypothetical protein BDV97DRAFT_355515 [Delphinella strobiligena]|nr:hypothetical protein BDV97DRAFT_355515 [Delphinella strobiligena]